MNRYVIAVTGGIGAGKSIVCSILKNIGYRVYDCDINARIIMDCDLTIKERLKNEVSHDSVDDHGNINRAALARVVFADQEKLQKLNSIVHSAVRTDILDWIERGDTPAFIETAILYQSGIDKIVDEVWEVIAPETIRISRVCLRNSLSPEEVLQRINSQKLTDIDIHNNTKTIVNDNSRSVLLQINQLLAELDD